MKQDHKRDIDYYLIEEKYDGTKVIHYSAFSYVYEDYPDDEDIEWARENYPMAVINDDTVFIREHELTFCYVPVSEYSNERLDLAQGCVQQYLNTIPLDSIEDYSGEYLPLKDVTEDTPCGDYWCYLEDE